MLENHDGHAQEDRDPAWLLTTTGSTLVQLRSHELLLTPDYRQMHFNTISARIKTDILYCYVTLV